WTERSQNTKNHAGAAVERKPCADAIAGARVRPSGYEPSREFLDRIRCCATVGMKLLHVIDHMGAGGPARSMLAVIRHANAVNPAIEHSVLSLRQDGYPPVIFAARQLGASVMRAPAPDATRTLLGSCDVALLHFWNTPGFWTFF